MSGLVRDSVFGQLARLASGGRVFRYPDEIDPSIREKYINPTKSANLALYGTVQPPHEADEKEDVLPSPSSASTSDPKEDLEKDLEKDEHTPLPTSMSPPATRITSITSAISRLHSSERRPNPLEKTTSHTNSFLNEMRTSNSRVAHINTASGKTVDPEKGRDIHLVDWYGPDDPEARSSCFT